MTTTTTTTAEDVADVAEVQGGPLLSGVTVREPVNSREEIDEQLVLGEIIVKTHDSATCVAWTLGIPNVPNGLTLKGIAAAARATAEWIEGLDEAELYQLGNAAGVTQVRIAAHEWSVPLLPHLAPAIARMMTSVINEPGSIGKVA